MYAFLVPGPDGVSERRSARGRGSTILPWRLCSWTIRLVASASITHVTSNSLGFCDSKFLSSDVGWLFKVSNEAAKLCRLVGWLRVLPLAWIWRMSLHFSHYLDTGVADRLAMHHVALWSRGAGHLGTVGISSMALAIMMIDVFKMSQVSMLFGLLHPCGVSLLNTASWVSAVRPTTMESRLNRNRQTLVPFATRGIFKSIYRPPVRNLTSHTPHEFISATNTTCATS